MRASCSRSTCSRPPCRRQLARACALALALTLGGCAGQIPPPSAAHLAIAAARWPGTTEQTLARGRHLYVYRCSGCHSLVLPQSQPPDAWPAAVTEMSTRAQLDRAETEAVIRYLTAVSESHRRRAAATP